MFRHRLNRTARSLSARSSNAARALLLAAAATGFSAAPLRADTVFWLNDSSGEWTVPSNWSSNPALPGRQDNVIIDRRTADPLITLGSGLQTINSLVSAEAISVTGGTLAIATTANLVQKFTLSGGTLLGGTYSGADIHAVTAGTINGLTLNNNLSLARATTLMLRNGLTLSNGASVLVGDVGDSGAPGEIRIDGTQAISGNGSIVFRSDATHRVRSLNGATLTLGNGISVTNAAGSATIGDPTSLHPIINNGSITAATAARVLQIVSSSFTNNGLLSAAAGTLDIDGLAGPLGSVAPITGHLDLNGAYTVNQNLAVQNGTLTLGGDWTNTSTITLNSGTLNLAGAFQPADLGAIARTGGTVALTGLLNNAGSEFDLSRTGALLLSGGTILGGKITTTDPAATLTATGLNNVLDGVTLDTDLGVGGTVILRNDLNLNGRTVNLGAGAPGVLRIDGPQAITGTGEVVLGPNSGSFQTYANTDSTLTIGSGITIRSGSLGGTFLVPIVNDGLISAQTPNQAIGLNVGGAKPITNNGTFEARNGGTLNVFNAGTTLTNFDAATGTLTGGIYRVIALDPAVQSTLFLQNANIRTNAADISLVGSKTILAAANGLTANTGSLTISNGRTFTTVGDFSNTGQLTVGSASTFTVSGALAQLQGTTLTAGTYNLLGGTLNLSAGAITINQAAVALGASARFPALASLADNQGSLAISHGHTFTATSPLQNSGKLSVAAGSSLNGTDLTITGGTTTFAGNAQFNTLTILGGTNTVTPTGNVSAGGLTIGGGTNLIEGGGLLATGPGGLTLDGGAGITVARNTPTAANGILRLGGKLTVNHNPNASSAAFIAGSDDAGCFDLGGQTRTFFINDSPSDPDLDISAKITNGGIIKDGPGTLQLSGTTPNDYTGPTILTAGVLRLAKDSNVIAVAGDIVLDGGKLEVINPGQISENSSIIVNQGMFRPRSERIRRLEIRGGDFELADGKDLSVTGPEPALLANGRSRIAAGSFLDAPSLRSTGGDNIIDEGGQVRVGPGGLTLERSSFRFPVDAGPATGVLLLRGNINVAAVSDSGIANFIGNRLPPAPGVTGGVVDLAGAARQFSVIAADNPAPDAIGLLVNARIVNGSLVKNGAGNMRLGGPSSNLYTGPTTIDEGTLELDKDPGFIAIPSDVEIRGGRLLHIRSEQIANSAKIALQSGFFELPAVTETVANFENRGGVFRVGPGAEFNVTDPNTSVWAAGTNEVAGTMTTTGLVVQGGTNTIAPGGVMTIGSSGIVFGEPVSGADVQIQLHAGSTPGQIKLSGSASINAQADTGTATISVAGSGTVAGTLDLGAMSRSITVNDGIATTDMVVSARITNGGIQKDGLGVLRLSGVNNYAMGTTLSEGTLQVTSSSALGTASVTFDGGTLQILADGPITLPNALAAADDASVKLKVSRLTSGGAFPAATLSTLQLDGALEISGDAGSTLLCSAGLTLAAPASINTTLPFTVSGPISGTFALTKTGTGTLTLSGTGSANTHSTTTVTQGVLELSRSAIAIPSTLTISSGATVRYGASNQIADTAPITLNAAQGAPTLDLNNHNDTVGSITFTAGGNVTTGAGVLTLGGDVAFSGASGAATLAGRLSLGSQARTFSISNGSSEIDLAVSAAIEGAAGLTKSGAGLLHLSATNTFTGPITVSAGTLAISSDASLGNAANSLTLASATLQARNSITSARTLNLSSATLDVFSGHSLALSGPLAITNTLTKTGSGSLTLSGSTTFAGTPSITLSAGALTLQSTLGATPAASLTAAAGTTLTFAANQSLSALTLSGASAVLATGQRSIATNALTLDATARLDLADGGLIIRGSSSLDAPRQLLTSGRASTGGVASGKWNGASGLTSSTAAAAAQDNTEDLSLGYALNSELLTPFTTFLGQSVSPTDILIRYTRNADANLDGVVNNNDITILAGFYRPGTSGRHWHQADFNYDGFTDNNDITILAGFYNPSASPLSPSTSLPLLSSLETSRPSLISAVPEPSALLLPLPLLFLRRRRSCRFHHSQIS